MTRPMPHRTEAMRDGIIGILATGGGTALSLVNTLEAWIRLASVSVGFIIGLVTLWRMLRRPRP